MKAIPRALWSLLILSLIIGAAGTTSAESSDEKISDALQRALDRSDYAVKRKAAELRDVADPDWGGFRLVRSASEWLDHLTPDQYRATREKVADKPSAGEFVRHDAEGTFHCACGNPLFHSHHKLADHTGYPSFSQAAAPDAVVTDLGSEWSGTQEQVELLCSVCGAHLGHVDPGESAEEALSFVVNSSALVFQPVSAE